MIIMIHLCYSVDASLFQCTLCEPNTFCFQDIKQNCPTHSTSVAGTDNITDCICKPGYYRVDHECVLCPANNFCPGDQKIYACPLNSISFTGAHNLSMCFCEEGFFFDIVEDQHTCISCLEGKYKDFVGNTICTLCPSDTYNSNQQSTHVDECLPCPALTVSSTGSSNINQCVARTGAFAETNNPLTAQLCPPTTYQNGINQTTCKQCSAETYQAVYGATAQTACNSCPEYSQIVDGPGDNQTDCICNYGYTGPDGGFCTSCSAGTYKSILGSSECVDTPINTFSLSGSTIWQNCPANSSSEIASTSIKNCSCHKGFSMHVLNLNPYETKCTPCAEGKYKHIDGNLNCYECEAGTFASGIGNTICSICDANKYSYGQSNNCISCGQYQYSLSGSASEESCGCIAGYEYVNSSCHACPIGKFRQQNQSHNQVNRSYERCEFCDEGKYTLGTGSTSSSGCLVCASNKYVDENWNCVDCFDFSTSTHQSHGYESCICNAGYTLGDAGYIDIEVCVACAEGKYKSLLGNQECTTCPIGKYGIGGQGSIDKDSACIACPANTYGSIDELSDLAICVQCVANSVSLPGSISADTCVCDVGFSKWLDSCIPCAGSYYKNTIGDESCTPCSLQTFTNVTGSTQCLNCPSNSQRLTLDSTLNVKSCICKPGFTGSDGETCNECVGGTFKTTYGNNSCIGCGNFAYFPLSYDKNINHCQVCPENSISLSGQSYGIEQCICEQGYYRFDNLTCVQCAENFYCPDEHHMYECPAHTQAPVQSYTISQCTCLQGYYGLYSNCTLCTANFYCNGGNTNPLPCMNNATTQGKLGSTNISSCVCNPGFFESVEIGTQPYCQLCPENTYCYLDSLWYCPSNSSASRLSTSIDDCYCDTGLKLDAQTKTCNVCEQNEICSNDGTVQICARNATNTNQYCLCPVGTYCDGRTNSNLSCIQNFGTHCTLCPEDSYCVQNQIIPCNTNEVSTLGSFTSSNCKCADGFYRLSGNCIQCPDNFYCINEFKYSLTTYDSNLITVSEFLSNQKIFLTSSDYPGAGAARIQDAICLLGMFRTSKSDLCKPCPLNYFCPSEYDTSLPNVVQCPENEFTYTTGSSTRTECICVAGFKLSSVSSVMKCLPCETGERCQGGLVVEEQCHMQNKIANLDHSACVCHVGFGFYNFECQICPPGAIKPEIGDTQCNYCGINEYAANATHCLKCPMNSEARPGSTQCFCAKPYVWNGDECKLCETGYYRGQVFISQNQYSGICLRCPLNSTSISVSTMISGIQACTCSKGFNKYPQNVSNEFICVKCAEGFYEVNGVCTSCAMNAWSPEGSYNSKACQCNILNSSTCHTQLLDGSCQGECAKPPTECNACKVGYFKQIYSSIGNEETCEPCSIDTYQNLIGQTSCINCPQFSSHFELGIATESTCKCDAGFTKSLNTSLCESCTQGYYKQFRGDESCISCEIGKYNPHLNATFCISCFEATNSDSSFNYYKAIESVYYSQYEFEILTNNSLHLVMHSNTTLHTAATSVYDCTCQAGQQAVDLHNDVRVCSYCIPGTFKPRKGFDACFYCGSLIDEYGAQYKHHYGDTNSGATDISHCISCPAFSGQEEHLIGPGGFLMDDITDCKCFRGHENRTVSGCTNCSAYKIQPLFSDNLCVYCEAGFYFVHSTLECLYCTLSGNDGSTHSGFVSNIIDSNFAWASSQYDCVCNLGYERLLDECSPCLPGYYRNNVLLRTCSFCDIDTYQSDTKSTSCNNCPSNSQTRGAVAQTNIFDCICNAGYQALKLIDNEGVCEQCPAGKYRSNRTREEALHDCIECPANFYCPIGSVYPNACPTQEVSSAGSSKLEDCECVGGRGRNNGRFGQCTSCPPGSFAPGRNNVECTLCPQNKNTSTGAINLSECKCIPGHGISGNNVDGDCSPCLNGFFASGGKNVACLHCGFGTITEPAEKAFSPDCCLCDARIGLYEID